MKSIESTAFSGLGFVPSVNQRSYWIARNKMLNGLGMLDMTPTESDALRFGGAAVSTALGVILFTQTGWKKWGLFFGVAGGLGLVNATLNRKPRA